jgi:hypothetical protein
MTGARSNSESIKFTVRPAKIGYVRVGNNEQAAVD